MILSMIVAVAEDRVIGKNNQLPWHLPEDLKRFKKITMGHSLIMGQKTFESLGKPLPGRRNIVLSDDPSFGPKGVTVVRSWEEAMKACKDEKEAFIIGGASVYKFAFPLIDRFYLTRIHKRFDGDAFFPEFDLEKDFKVMEKTDHHTDAEGGFSYSTIIADRKR